MPDGPCVTVDVSVAPNVGPGRHLVIFRFPAAGHRDKRLVAARGKLVLTRREREILTLVALGHTGVQIARDLWLSPTTVQTHVMNALTKLGARNRAHGITIALQTGELDLDAGDGATAATQLAHARTW